jgi:hypothetical protein
MTVWSLPYARTGILFPVLSRMQVSGKLGNLHADLISLVTERGEFDCRLSDVA